MPREPMNFSGVHRICKLVVLLCFLHISVTLIFYVTTFDLRPTFLQKHQYSATGRRNSTARPYASATNVTSAATAAGRDDDGGSKGPLLAVSGGGGPQPTAAAAAGDDERVTLGKCPQTSPLLVGPLRIEFNTPVSLEHVTKENPDVRPGGRYTPKDCIALQKVAIIIPFRNRGEHLKFWLFYLHPILQRQQLDYGIYVINQGGTESFNRAKLLNVGYTEALKDHDYGCFVFSDVDLIPMDDRNTYACFDQPRHLSVSIDKFGFRLPYYQIFGGASSMSKEQFLKINGFSNNYWGWGGEDDDIYNRLSSRGMSISRPSGVVGNCRMIRHDRDKKNQPNPQRFNRLAHTRENMGKDGINSLTYTVTSTERLPLYTYITVEVGKP